MATYDSFAARAAELITSMEAGADNLENKIGEDLALYILDMMRGVAIKEHLSVSRNSRNTKLHPSLQQEYFPVYDLSLQETDPVTGKKCKVVIEVPAVVLVDDLIDGMSYIGGSDGSSPFRRVRSRQQLSGILRHELIAPSHDVIYAYTRPDNMAEIYGDNAIEDILVSAIFEMPSRVPDVNWDIDRYPINNAIMDRVKILANQLILNPIYTTPQDAIQDMQIRLDALKLQVIPK